MFSAKSSLDFGFEVKLKSKLIKEKLCISGLLEHSQIICSLDYYVQHFPSLFLSEISIPQDSINHIFHYFLIDNSPAERRHSQVKKWTRNVDIFEKDFVFVPINEASHWYLAVICYPGLKQEQFESSSQSENSSEELKGDLCHDCFIISIAMDVA